MVPEAILRELRELDDSLAAASRLDGRRRSSLLLSAPQLPAPLPLHDVEPGLPSLEAHVRPEEAVGGTAGKWLRRAGRVPARVHSLPPGAEGPGADRNLLLHLDERELARMVRAFGRNGCTARVLQLNLVRPAAGADDPAEPTSSSAAPAGGTPGSSSSGSSESSSSSGSEPLGVLRVKPVRVHMNAVSQRLEGVDLLYCPQDRVVLVDVPVRLVNDDLAPGVKKGGWMSMFKRTVRYKALGSAVPPYIELNVRHLELEQEVLVRDLPVPPGTKIYEKNFNAPVVRCTTDVGKD